MPTPCAAKLATDGQRRAKSDEAFFRDLCRLYLEEEIKQRVFKGQSTARGQLCYLEDKWGGKRFSARNSSERRPVVYASRIIIFK
jgi:hypothetical protein